MTRVPRQRLAALGGTGRISGRVLDEPARRPVDSSLALNVRRRAGAQQVTGDCGRHSMPAKVGNVSRKNSIIAAALRVGVRPE